MVTLKLDSLTISQVLTHLAKYFVICFSIFFPEFNIVILAPPPKKCTRIVLHMMRCYCVIRTYILV